MVREGLLVLSDSRIRKDDVCAAREHFVRRVIITVLCFFAFLFCFLFAFLLCLNLLCTSCTILIIIIMYNIVQL